MFKQFPGVMIALTIAVGLLSFPSAALATEINIEDDDTDHVGQIIVIIDPFPETVTYCGVTYDEYRAVIVDLAGGEPALVTAVGIQLGTAVHTGDRYTIDSQTACDGRLQINATRI